MAPLKGAHVETTVYPLAGRSRSMGDIDFLVRPEEWQRTLDMMLDLGFRTRRPPSSEWWMHEAGFYLELSPGREILFEAHRYLVEPRRITLDHNALWARSVPSHLEGLPCRRLADEDHVVHTCLHAAIHRLMKLGRALEDLELLFRHASPDHDRLIKRAKEWRATRATWLLLTLVDRQQPELGLGTITAALTPPVIPRAVLRALVPNEEATRLRSLNHRVQAALLWPWIIDSPQLLLRIVTHHPKLVQLIERPK